jgi:hypothetical protein
MRQDYAAVVVTVRLAFVVFVAEMVSAKRISTYA